MLFWWFWKHFLQKIIEKISLEKLYDDFIEQYQLGNFTEGVCNWNGDDALMGPRSFAHKFKKEAEGMGYSFEQYQGYADELEYIKFQVLNHGSILKNFLDNKDFERDTWFF